MSLKPSTGLGSKSGFFWSVPNMHESDDPRGKEAGDERLQVSDSLSETDPIPPNRAQDTGSICALIPPGGWAGVELEVISAVGHGDCALGVDDLGPVISQTFDGRVGAT
jgi:hypothetical protein